LKKKILITGGEGLIGNAIKKILEKKKLIIKSFDIQSKKKIDITKKNFFDNLKKFNPDVVIHAAAHPGALSMESPLKNININVVSSFKIIDWCAKNSKKLVFLSSSAVYKSSNKGNKELEVTRPRTIYGINKIVCENYIKVLGDYKNLDWVIFRLFATYGPGQKPNLYQGIVNVIITQLRMGNKVIIKGSLKRKRDLIYVGDAAKIIVKSALFNKKINRVFNLGSGKNITIENLVKKIGKIFKKKITIEVQNKTFGDPFCSISDNKEVKKYFKIKKFTPLGTSLKMMIAKLNKLKKM
jgi:UDP-glucose 4-epimerase